MGYLSRWAEAQLELLEYGYLRIYKSKIFVIN